MDILEKLNKAFAGWYESWFGDSVGDLRPKDVLRKIIGAMEDNRKEGLDNRVYVPNKYILQIVFSSDDEREYLLAFLEKEELEAALRKYMSQNKYFIRGPLDFTIEEPQPAEDEERPEKLRVVCKWDAGPLPREEEEAPPARPYVIPEFAEPMPPPSSASSPAIDAYEEEEYTVAATDMYDAGTVSPPVLRVKHVDGSTKQFVLNKPTVLVGRSKRLKNDLVLDQDGMVSKRHAKLSLDDDGYAIRDLDSTNGVWVNDEKVSVSPLKNGDVIRLGSTEIIFEEAGAHHIPRTAGIETDPFRPRLIIDMPNRRVEQFRLPSETIIGKALTSDVHIEHSSISRRHAHVFSRDGHEYFIEDLDSERGTKVNGTPVRKGSPVKLEPGDRIKVGEVEMRYELG